MRESPAPNTPTAQTLRWVSGRGPRPLGVLGPVVLGVAAGEVLADGFPRAGPEPGQVGGHLDRAVGRRQQRQRDRHPAAGHGRVLPRPEHVLHTDRHRRPLLLVVDRRRPAAGQRPRPGRQLVELGAERPRQHRAQQDPEVEPIEVAPSARADEVRRQPFVERSDQPGVRHVRPGLPERVPEERDPRPQLRARRRPRQHGQPGRPDTVDEGGGRRRTGVGPPPFLAEPQGVETALDPLDELVAVGVPLRAGGPR